MVANRCILVCHKFTCQAIKLLLFSAATLIYLCVLILISKPYNLKIFTYLTTRPHRSSLIVRDDRGEIPLFSVTPAMEWAGVFCTPCSALSVEALLELLPRLLFNEVFVVGVLFSFTARVREAYTMGILGVDKVTRACFSNSG